MKKLISLGYSYVTSLDFATPLAFNAPNKGFSRDDLRKILHAGQKMARYKSAKKYCRKFQPPETE